MRRSPLASTYEVQIIEIVVDTWGQRETPARRLSEECSSFFFHSWLHLSWLVLVYLDNLDQSPAVVSMLTRGVTTSFYIWMFPSFLKASKRKKGAKNGCFRVPQRAPKWAPLYHRKPHSSDVWSSDAGCDSISEWLPVAALRASKGREIWLLANVEQ